ncbi:MAG: M14-type cytosolic carboxypeptidase, partial [Phycisphaeraceae bacterium]|nr:M14-type cytosolic carboxypeptidase [Phycisphaeraceae bacterium]
MRLLIKSGCWIWLLAATPLLGQWKVSSDFEGGSAKFLSIDPNGGRVVFSPGGDPKRGWPCWWYFRVDNIRPGRELTLELDAGSMRQAGGGPLAENWAMPTHASYSIDGGKTWRLTPAGRRRGKRMVWKQSIAGKTACFAWGPPFVPSDASRQ